MAILTPLFFGFRNFKSIKSKASLHLILNVLISTSFFYLRYTPYICSKLPASERLKPCQLDWRESELAMFLIIFISIKNRNAISWEQATRRALTYCKVVCGFLFFRMQTLSGILYLIILGLRIKFFNEENEKYSKMTEHIVHLTPETLEKTLHSDHKITWIIEAFTNWSNECNEIAPVFSELAQDYGHQFLRFGKIDVGKYPKWAKDYSINTSPMSKQLPTILLFQGGKVHDRRPYVSGGKVVKFRFGYEDIEREFNLKTLKQQASLKKGSAKLPEFVPTYEHKPENTETKKEI